LSALKRYATELEVHFLSGFLTAPTLAAPSRKEALQVGAYIVLVHGAMENFIEGLALWILARIDDRWTNAKRANRCAASLLLYHPAPIVDGATQVTIYDNLRESIASANQTHSNAIYNNHGISLSHVRELFYPLGVDVPNDPTFTASLDMVISMRHHWAHQYRFGAKVVKSAQDAKTAVADCLNFAEQLSSAVASVRP
jgi:hypothetical protein